MRNPMFQTISPQGAHSTFGCAPCLGRNQVVSPQGAQRAAWGRSPAPGGGPERPLVFPESGRVLGPKSRQRQIRMRIFQELSNGTSGEPMEKEGWDRWAEGIGCPLCGPRHESNEYRDFIARLDVSSLHLPKNQAYRSHCLLILDIRHATRPDHLSSAEWTAFCTDLYTAEKALIRTLQPDHINIEVMGNVVPHLHWQIVPRYRADSRWGAPIWMTTKSEMPVTTLSETARTDLVQNLRNAINQEILGRN